MADSGYSNIADATTLAIPVTYYWPMFGLTPVLDNFNRADEYPVTGWTGGLLLRDGTLASSGSGFYSETRWDTEYPANQEAYFTIAAVSAHGCQFFLYICNSGGNNRYYLEANLNAGNTYLQVNRGPTILAGGYLGFELVAGDKLGIQAYNGHITVWYNLASNPGWVQHLSGTDESPLPGGYIWVGLDDNYHSEPSAIDDFGGGEMHAFPSTPVLDNFNRANEGPPPNSSWHTPSEGAGCVVNGNHLTAQTYNGEAVWDTANIGPDCEVYCDIPVITTQGDVRLYARVQNRDLVIGGTCYELRVYYSSGWYARLRRKNNGTSTLLLLKTINFAAGDSIGLSLVGSVIRVYHRSMNGAESSMFSYDDAAPITSAGYLGVYVYIGVGSPDRTDIDNFGGGTV